MKKNILKISRFLGMVLVVSSSVSCTKFLDEELLTQRSTDYFMTLEGLADLEAGIYYNLRFHFSSECGFATTNYGTDEFRVGGDASNGMWDNYDGNFSSLITAVNVNTVMANTLWDNMYVGINSANLLLENSELYVSDQATKDRFQGTAHFIRAFNYQKLVSQYGGVPIKLVPSNTVEREFTRASAEAVMQQVIADFTAAYELLPPTASEPGRLSKDAAAHFLAKAYLFRASEVNDSWNGATKSDDLVQALHFANEVINGRQLATNFADLWNYTAPDGANENLNEIILSAQFTFDRSTRGRFGNQMHLFYLSQYLNLPHMTRDIAGGREYQRLRTNYYAYNVYDRVNDSRFWKSFKTKYAVNNPGAGSIYEMGDLSIMYIVNSSSDVRFPDAASLQTVTDHHTGKIVPTVFASYVGGNAYLDSDGFQNRFAPLNKFIDGSREALNETIGHRDGILARLADTYLIAAEACIRQGNYPLAITYINTVRRRAAYKDNEDRRVYTDGAAAFSQAANPVGWAASTTALGVRNSFYAENSYYESNNIPETTVATNLDITSFSSLPAEDEAIIATLGYSSEYDRALCFLLNERSRELMGEFYRWEDLSRTKTLLARARAFNRRAAPNIQDRHNLRPIPQSHLDVVQRDGRAFTPAEKSAEQNPGY